MDIQVKLNNFRTSPKKVRQVADLVRGKDALQAQNMLLFTVNKSSKPVLKLLNSAIASAKHDLHLEESNLFISKITVDEGPKMKRWHPMSRGRAYPIIKRSSHIVLTLSEKSEARNPKSETKTEIKKEIKTSKSETNQKKINTKPKTKKITKKTKVK